MAPRTPEAVARKRDRNREYMRRERVERADVIRTRNREHMRLARLRGYARDEAAETGQSFEDICKRWDIP